MFFLIVPVAKVPCLFFEVQSMVYKQQVLHLNWPLLSLQDISFSECTLKMTHKIGETESLNVKE